MSRRPGPFTLYEGVRRLNPGAALHLDTHGFRERTYWAPRFAEPIRRERAELAAELRDTLERAVAQRLDPAGSTAILMSGGLDSSAVAALAATAPGAGRVSAYSAVFPEHPAVDESGLIAELRATLGLAGVTAEVRPGGLIASALDSIQRWELPLRSWGDFWALPLLSAAAAQGHGVTLGGDGGDELFGPRSYFLSDRLRAGHPLGALRLARELPGAGASPARRDLARIMGNTALAGALPYWLHSPIQRRSLARAAPGWLRPETRRELRNSDDPLAWKRLDGPLWWSHAAHTLTRGVEEAGVFEHQRRRAATAGLEARHPLFALEVLELALRQPPLATLDRYLSRPLLRASVADIVPNSVRRRPGKAWFDSILVDCLSGADGKVARRLLGDQRSELRAYLDIDALQRAMFDPPSTAPGLQFRWMWQLWRLISAECWLRAQANPTGTALPDGVIPSEPRVSLRPAGRADQYLFQP
jgi:asparagine synthase (glutamine-hydrolysing)